MSKSEYNLKAKPRIYYCDCCKHEHHINTNHTGSCLSICPNCSWRGGFDTKGKHYRADTDKHRPHYYLREISA